VTPTNQQTYWNRVFGASFPRINRERGVRQGPSFFILPDGTQIVSAVKAGKIVGSLVLANQTTSFWVD
jgi:hypothetical protein